MSTDKVLDTYYAIFAPGKMPGSGDFLRCDPSSAGSAAGPLEPLPVGSRAVYLFSTKAKAEEVVRRHSLNDEWSPVGLSIEHTKTMLLEGRAAGIHQYVVFNPGSVVVGVQPINEFIVSMPYRTRQNSEPAE